MKTQDLLIQLSILQGERLSKELDLYKDMFYNGYNDELVGAIKDNWTTDEEINKTFKKI